MRNHSPFSGDTPSSGGGQSNTPRNNILLVEDDGDLIELLKAGLEANDFQVECATNGTDGLKLIMESDYDAIVCDMMMPNLSGDMFYLAVQRVKPHLCKRFIFMSGYKGEEKIDHFIRKIHGMLLWKPFSTNDLLNSIQLILETTGP